MDLSEAGQRVIDRVVRHSFGILNYSAERKLPRPVRYLLRGRPRTRSARMLRSTSDDPASIVLALERRNWYTHPSPSPTCPAGPAMSTAVSVIRWLSSDHMSLRIEPSGPGIPLRFTAVTAR